MAGSSRELERRLDDVYRAPPEEFVEARDRVAKELRERGDREAADEVKRARKPTAPAWLVNRTSLDHPRRVKALLAAAEEQRKALAKGSAAKLRAAAKREGEALDRLVAAAGEIAGENNRAADEPLLDQVRQSFQAIAVDDELRERVVGGRLERPASAATLGTPTSGSVPRASRRDRRDPGAARARRELTRLERKLEAALERQGAREARLAEVQEGLRAAKDAVAESKRRVKELRGEIAKARKRA